jgi:hypothetical protein
MAGVEQQPFSLALAGALEASACFRVFVLQSPQAPSLIETREAHKVFVVAISGALHSRIPFIIIILVIAL